MSGPAIDREKLVMAAVLVTEDAVTDEKIAAALGISKRTLERWKARPEMQLVREVFALRMQRDWRRTGRRLWSWNVDELGPDVGPPFAWIVLCASARLLEQMNRGECCPACGRPTPDPW